MSKGPGSSDADVEASRWIARLEAHDVSLEDHQRFRVWLAASEENQRAYRAMSDTWDQLDALAFLPASNADLAPPPPPHRGVSRRALFLGGGAALAVVGGGALWLSSSSDSYAATYTTPVGGRKNVALRDGSEINLNADTALAVDFSPSSRTIRLQRGEALFNVAPGNRPFEVRTAFGAFVARGTSFLVKLTVTGARLSVLEGEVRTERAGAAAVPATPGHEILLTSEAADVSAVSEQTSARRLAWRDGMLAFDGETLGEAVTEVERQTGVQFAFAEASLKDLRIGGYISATDVDAFITLLRENLGLTVSRVGDRIILGVGERTNPAATP